MPAVASHLLREAIGHVLLPGAIATVMPCRSWSVFDLQMRSRKPALLYFF